LPSLPGKVATTGLGNRELRFTANKLPEFRCAVHNNWSAFIDDVRSKALGVERVEVRGAEGSNVEIGSVLVPPHVPVEIPRKCDSKRNGTMHINSQKRPIMMRISLSCCYQGMVISSGVKTICKKEKKEKRTARPE
jgi:hypothetical protein